MFSNRFAGFVKVPHLDPQGHKPRRDLGLAVTAVRVRLHAHDANDLAGAHIGERPQRPVLDLAEAPQAFASPLVGDPREGKPGAQRPLAERGVEPGNRPAAHVNKQVDLVRLENLDEVLGRPEALIADGVDHVVSFPEPPRSRPKKAKLSELCQG